MGTEYYTRRLGGRYKVEMAQNKADLEILRGRPVFVVFQDFVEPVPPQ